MNNTPGTALCPILNNRPWLAPMQTNFHTLINVSNITITHLAVARDIVARMREQVV